MTFSLLRPQPQDPLLSLIGEFGRDMRDSKIDLSVGVYRNENGVTPVMAAVKQAEAMLQASQSSKSYLGPEGNPAFIEALAPLLFGSRPGQPFAGLQTAGGTAALRIAADLLAIGERPRRIWLGLPTWANHVPVFSAAGLRIETYRAIDTQGQRFDLEATLEALDRAEPGDAVLLQGCCHNPTGIDPDADAWKAIGTFMAQRGLLPLIDIAYQGLGDGLEPDAQALRQVVGEVPEALIAYSCDKNFGLYRERVGALFIVAQADDALQSAASNASAITRSCYSMPPDHGAAVVAKILEDNDLAQMWRRELREMRDRIGAIRAAVAEAQATGPIPLAPIAQQKGMFSLLPLEPSALLRLKREHGIYMAPNGRINLAGLALSRVNQFTAALGAVTEKAAA